jgi:hypothetical protein
MSNPHPPGVSMADQTAAVPLPGAGPICYGSASDILLYKPAPEVGTHLPGVRDVGLWSTDQLRAYAHKCVMVERERCMLLVYAVDPHLADHEQRDWIWHAIRKGD